MVVSLEVSSLLIVESENDKFFIERVLSELNLSSPEISPPICSIDEYECLGGISKLKAKLAEIKFEKYEKLGVILDADKEGIQKRITLINEAFTTVCSDLKLAKINTFSKSSDLEIDVACYITNINGYGELEDIFKAIKSKDSTYADCLDAWRNCLDKKDKVISDKDFNKFWVSNYFRFDTCSNKEKKQANRKCNNEAAIKKDIWDLNNSVLDDLKEFLKLFN